MAFFSTASLCGLPLAGLLLASSPALQQGPAQAPPQQPQQPQRQAPPTIQDMYGKWIPMDQVLIVVNGDIITERRLWKKIDEELAKVSNTTQAELQAQINRVRDEEVESLLVRQAGEDLGLPAEAVEAHVSGQLRDDLDEAGGAFAFARQFRDDDTTALELKEDRTAEIYEATWKRKIAGFGSARERTPEDRYIRPGHLGQRYRRIQRTGRDLGYLVFAGAEPASFELQILLITPQGAGSIQDAATKIEQAHGALTSGQADWDDLIETIGELGNSGLTGKFPLEQIELLLDPGNGAVLDFAVGAEPNSLSPIFQFPEVNQATGERRLAGFAIYKLLDRTTAKIPDYNATDVQKYIRRTINEESDETRWGDALTELKRTAYIWHPQYEAQKAEQRAARERRNQEIQKAREENAARFRAETAAEKGGEVPQP